MNYHYARHHTQPPPPANPDPQQFRLLQHALLAGLFRDQTPSLTEQHRAQQALMQQHAEHTRIMLRVSGKGGEDPQANPSAPSSQQ